MEGYRLRLVCCLLLPVVQLASGISNPSWLSLPFFICSCVGLVDWSLTSNFLGLFRWWKLLWVYAGFNIGLLYVYQLPVWLPQSFQTIADSIGLYKASVSSDWQEICSGISLMVFYYMLSFVKHDLEDMEFMMSMREGSLTEQLLPSRNSLFVRQLRSGVRHTNILLRGKVFRFFSINWFTYGFPDMEIWEMVGLWHYPIPGFFLLAQFCLGILVALGNLVNNSVFLCRSNEERQLSDENRTEEVKEDTKVLIVATIAWGLRKCSRPIMLLLIFLIAAKPGLVHAVYMIFFFAYLLSHEVNKKMRKCLILLCEAHFAALYVLQLSLVSRILEQKGSISMEVLSELGLVESDSTWEFLEIALLACLCAVHNHGFDMLFSFSAIVQHTPCLPIGFGILKAGLNKSVLLSVYATSNVRDRDNNSHERRVALYLSAIGEKFLSIYRSFGTYIAFLTILFTVYLVRPNYISFGYIFLLLIWIIGRQLVERTKQRLWFPLKAYAIVVFIFIYILSIFPTFEAWMSKKVNLYVCFGYNSDASLLENLWESLAIVIVMQLYSYERRQSKYMNLEDADPLQFGIWGFIKRFLIWHSQKILFVALFYASLSPISAFGFLYILGLILSSALPKASKIPSKSFLIYTGFLVSTEYLFQMWGKQAKMFPGQKHHDLSLFLGLQVYRPSFEGLEAGLRAKVLVIAACILQYNVFHWLERMHSSLSNEGRSEEPCPLFVSEEDLSTVVLTPNGDNDTLSESGEPSPERIKSNSWSSFRHVKPSQDLSPGSSFNENGSSRKFSFGYIWGSIKESHKWNKKRVVSLRQERFEMQKTMLKVYLKFWTENMFNLFGLEINMIALLLASFALLNAMSMLYIASLATCVLLTRPIIRKLWPMFVVLFAIILLSEYFAMWSTMMPLSQHVSTPTDARCHDCWKISRKCETVDYIYESYMFSSSEFDYVFRYLEAEQIGAIVREQEKKATWKTEQLQHIRESEEKKRQRNLQVEKMKAEMLNLQIQLHSTAQADSSPANNEGLRRRKTLHLNCRKLTMLRNRMVISILIQRLRAENPFTVEFTKQQMDASTSEITELRDEAGDNPVNDSDEAKKGSINGNQAVSSLVSFLNISPEDSDSNEPPYLQEGHSGDERSTNNKQPHLSSSSSMLSDKSRTSGFASWQIGRIIRHIWSQMRSNNDVSSITAKDGEWFSVGFGNGKGGALNREWVQTGSSWSEKARKFSINQTSGHNSERIESGINQLLQLVHDETARMKCLIVALVPARPAEQFKSLTPASDITKEILKAQQRELTYEVGFPYHIISSVIKNKSEFLEYYQLEDQFPKEYVFILMIIFFLIVVDRVITSVHLPLEKSSLHFQHLSFHLCCHEYAWDMDTSQQNTAGLALRAIYLTKAVSLALQAMQIRYGVPHQSTLYRQF
ncbi:piezo-type mechanosensitive ion channel component [Perilla frutescens var. frutescens]|nr:piezo-type mechanosensitive ion channel component [Perilla frutescens var. frutescens]